MSDAHPPPEDEPDPPGDPERVAGAVCLRLLTARARSRAELATALRRRGVPDPVADAVLDRFAEVGLVDDAALAATYARTQHQERGLAGRAVAAKLRQRGIDDDTARAALQVIDRDSELAAARRLVARKQRALAHLDPHTQARRLYGLLGRRGYPPGLVDEVVREAVRGADELPDGDEPD